ncbi:MAG TPA: hypothetical protein VLZ50_07340 [Terracidiphilus sp.]|nr:hypothetical protein [Terracidiphilus sp.]
MRFSISTNSPSLLVPALLALAPALWPQEPSPPAASAQAPTASQSQPASQFPIAIVPLDLAHPDRGPSVSGTFRVSNGKAVISSSAEVTSGAETTQVELPRRGVLRVCASTKVHLASDTTVPADQTPGLMMALDHGAVEADFATGRNADILLTPDFRILIGGRGAVDVKVRIGDHGDTCVDNPGADAPYVLVSSVFDGGAYRVQPGQRVLFEHGSLQEVNDNEKEPCGCPSTATDPNLANAFPLAQSQGMAPLAQPAPNPPAQPSQPPPSTPPLVYNAKPDADANTTPAAQPEPAPAAAAPAPAVPRKKSGFFHRLGGFFRRIFGAE